MNELVTLMRAKARHLGGGIIKADGFINHQILPGLTARMGRAFAEGFRLAGVTGVTRVLTAEVSGIAPALATAMALDVPMVFARKKKPASMTGRLHTADAVSRTKGEAIRLHLSADYLDPGDRVLIIDDFLATASTLEALVSIAGQGKATVAGIGCVVEKCYENGRARLEHLEVPILALARVDLSPDGQTFSVS
jgi:xanthine phosphoribosyltransferase